MHKAGHSLDKNRKNMLMEVVCLHAIAMLVTQILWEKARIHNEPDLEN